jgi:hypothetical protein
MLIEVVHSKWGVVKAELEFHYNKLPDGSKHKEACFKYPNSKSLLGCIDEEAGGSLGHPSEEVDKYMRMYHQTLIEVDYDAYQELELLLIVQVDRADPDFFTDEAKYLFSLR